MFDVPTKIVPGTATLDVAQVPIVDIAGYFEIEHSLVRPHPENL